MPTIFELITEKLNRLDSIPKKFLTNVDKAQYQILDSILKRMSEFNLTPQGTIQMTAENMLKAEELINDLEQVFNKSDYIESVTEFASSFDIQKKITDKYFSKAFPDFSKKDFAEAVFQSSKKSAVESLSSATVKTKFLEPLKEQITQIVSSGMDYRDAVKYLREYAIGNDEESGKLLKYSKQIAYDSIAKSDRAYTSAVAEELQSEWFYYAGGLIKTSRDFCRERNGSYFHYKEVEDWSKLKWDGKMENTTSQNIYENLGGWNCNHSLIPVSIDRVPEKVVRRNIANGNYVLTKFEVENLAV